MMQVLVGFRARFADHSDVITEHTATLAQVTGDLRSLGEAIERIQKAERFSTVEGQIESLRDLIRELVREKSKD
jgi:chromosomal replication initiation ATPase DnaA